MDKFDLFLHCYIATLAVAFGAYVVSQGNDANVVWIVFAALGALGGFAVGKKTSEKPEQ